MSDHSTKTYRLGRRPGKQGPRPLPNNQGRVEKLVTGKISSTNSTTKTAYKMKLIRNTLTVGTWNVQTLWAVGKLELLRNEMKHLRYVDMLQYQIQPKTFGFGDLGFGYSFGLRRFGFWVVLGFVVLGFGWFWVSVVLGFG